VNVVAGILSRLFGNILFRMILQELCKVFLMSLIGITGILLMAGIIAEASQQGLSPGQILAAIPLLIPSTLPYTIPATTLFASCVVYGRLSGDNEILAIKAAGINIIQVVKPGVILGLAMSLVTLALYYDLIPSTHRLLREMVFHDSEELIYSVLRRQGSISSTQLPYAMFVKSVQGRKLINVVLKRKKPDGEIDIVANAREAELRVEVHTRILHVHMKDGVAITPNAAGENDRAWFQDRVFDVELPKDNSDKDRRPRDMTWVEMEERINDLQKEIDKKTEEISAASALLLTTNPAADPQHIENLRTARQTYQVQVLHLHVEMLMRPALSAGCLCFILVGCPVGIWFSRSDYLSSFITCFLPIVLVYYPLMLCGTNMAKEAKFHPAVLVFAADSVVGLMGLWLFRRLLRN
jgi:lipopolysaccharide export system permease protein